MEDSLTILSGHSNTALAYPIPNPRSTPWDDDRALATWLGFVHLRNANTFRSYRNEAIRFRAFLDATKPENDPRELLLRDATEIDILLYEAHLRGRLRTGAELTPLVLSNEVMRRHGLRKQPFVEIKQAGVGLEGLHTTKPISLKDSSANQAMSILHALYQFWMTPDPATKMAYVGANPVKRLKRSSNRMQRQVDRNIPQQAIQALFESFDQRLNNDPENAASIQRQRWIASLLFGLWGRRSEIAKLKMGDFRHDGLRWVVTLERKGGKVQALPVASWLLKEMMAYRKANDLPPLPSSNEETPAILRIRPAKDLEAVSADLLYREVGHAAKLAADLLQEHALRPELDDAQREFIASKLTDLSPHWFRHSGASIAINSGAMSLEHASKMLGHSSPTITAEMYYHPEESLIAEGMEKLGAMR